MKNLFKRSAIAFVMVFGLSNTYAQNTPLEVVGKMFEAFGKGDMDGLKLTVSDNSVWVYEGPKEIPYTGIYNGKEGAVKFITNIVSNVDILDFKVNKMVADGNTVIVLGFEKQKIKKNGKILEQKWVQVYTVENGLITRMEEYANTDGAKNLFK